MPRKSTPKSSADKLRKKAAKRGAEVHNHIQSFLQHSCACENQDRRLSHPEVQKLCDEYLEHETKLKTFKTSDPFAVTLNIRFSDAGQMYVEEEANGNRTDALCAEALKKRMTDIKGQVGETAIEHRREIKKLESRCEKLEEFMQATMERQQKHRKDNVMMYTYIIALSIVSMFHTFMIYNFA